MAITFSGSDGKPPFAPEAVEAVIARQIRVAGNEAACLSARPREARRRVEAGRPVLCPALPGSPPAKGRPSAPPRLPAKVSHPPGSRSGAAREGSAADVDRVVG